MDDAQICEECGYDLTGLPADLPHAQCPECGTRYIPGAANSPPPWPGMWLIIARSSALFLGTLALATVFAILFQPKLAFPVAVVALAAGLIGPIHEAMIYGRRRSATESFARSRAGIILIGIAVNSVVLGALWAMVVFAL